MGRRWLRGLPREARWPRGYPRKSVLTVRDLRATTPGAYADLWRYALRGRPGRDVSSRWSRPVDEPLVHLLQEPRRLGATLTRQPWVRPVDVAGALGARRYSTDARIVLRGHGSVLPVERGARYLLEATGGEARRHAGRPRHRPASRVRSTRSRDLPGGTSFRAAPPRGRVDEQPGASGPRRRDGRGWARPPGALRLLSLRRSDLIPLAR